MPPDVSNRPLVGVLWMLASGLCFIGVNGVVRSLGQDLPAAQSAFIRFAFGVVFLAPMIWPMLRKGLPAGTLRLFAGRGVVHTAAVVFWFYAMARIPVAEVTAIGYLNPVLVTLGGALFFAEGLTLRRAAVVGVALLGAVIILRPGLRDLSLGHASQLCAAVSFAASYLFAKRLSGQVNPAIVVAMLSLTVTVFLLPVAIWVWVPVTLAQLAWLAVVAVLATGGHYFMSQAFGAAPLAVTQPVTFLQLIWATLMGVFVFGEAVDFWVLMGGAVIISAITVNTLVEARASSQRDAASPDRSAVEV